MRAPCLLLALTAASSLAQDAAAARASLEPCGRTVVLCASELPALRGLRPAQLWLCAARAGAVRAIPFQVDERVPGGEYAWSEGDERKSDVDEGRLDDDDELSFYARDAGDRLAAGELVLGQVAAHELELVDPAGGRAWAYLLAFPEGEPTPPGAPDDRASLLFREGEVAGFRGARLQLLGTCDENLLHLSELRLLGASGWGPDLLDRLKLHLRASYLFTGIERAQDEVRAGLRAWRDGPVRVAARLGIESYLIWGHWIRSVPGGARLVLWEDRLELAVAARVPVDLETDARSELRLSLDLAPEVAGLKVWTDKNPGPLRPGERLPRALDQSAPGWIAVGAAGSTVLCRVRPGESLRGAGNALYLRVDPAPDPPEDHPGAQLDAGWTLDLTGLRAGVHSLELELRAAPEEGVERLLRADTALQVVVR